MILRLVESSVRQRALVVLGFAIVSAIGIWQAFELPIDAVPDITNVQVQINTAVSALAPEEVEKQVTFPVESEMGGLPGMIEMRSLSKFGLSQVRMTFADGTDVYRIRQLVGERLQNAIERLPPGLQPRMAPVTTALGEIYYYTVSYAKDAPGKPSSEYEQLQNLRQVQETLVAPLLRNTAGVAEVNTSGGYSRQFVVLPDARRMIAAGMTVEDLAGKVSENLENAGGGMVEIGGEQVVIRAATRIQNSSEIGALPLKFGGGVEPLLVRDVAEVAIGSGYRSGASCENGREAVVGGAMMLLGGNSRRVADVVNAKVCEIQGKMPPGVVLRRVYNRSDLVNRTIRTVMTNLFEGAVLVVVVLFFMLGNARAACMVALTIPLSMLMAVTGMVQGRISGNLMSLGAIDFGLLIDGAVVMVENISRHLAQKRRELGREITAEERFCEVMVAAREVARPMFFGVLVITVVYIPILALTGIAGKMFHPMAWTVIMALVASLIIAVTLMPALCSWFLRGRSTQEGDSATVRACKRFYEPLLNWALDHRGRVVMAALGLFVVSLGVFWRLGAEFMPQLDEGTLLLQMIRGSSVGIETSVDLQKKTEKILCEGFPEVDHTFSIIGTADVAIDPMSPNVADTYVTFRPVSEWRRVNGHRITREELYELIRRELAMKVPGQSCLFTQPIQMRFNEMLAGTRTDLAVKIMGEDFGKLEELAGRMRDLLRKIPGSADVEFDSIGRSPMLEIRPDREAMRRLNVQADELNKAIRMALGGIEVGALVEGNRRFPVVIRLPERLRGDVGTIRRLPLRTEDGSLVLLEQVGRVEIAEQVGTVTRESGQRRVAVLVNVRGRDMESYIQEALGRIRSEVQFPPGYYLDLGGQYRNLEEARSRLRVIVPLALGFIFVLIFASFGSVRQTLLILLCVPLAMTGGVVALWLRGMPFTISAAVGFIALSGIATLNGIMLISFINQLRREGRPLRLAVVEGTLTRLRPKLMTALVASLGFVPMAFSTAAGATVQRPLATVVIGGIISSTFLTLVVLPTLYEWIERKREPNG